MFRCLQLARDAGRRGGTGPCILNAANEIAVAAFLADGIAFADIPGVVEQTLDAIPSEPLVSLEQVTAADQAAREHARQLVAVAA